jgi:hypothetical protein
MCQTIHWNGICEVTTKKTMFNSFIPPVVIKIKELINWELKPYLKLFFLKCRLDWTQYIYEYCEFIINRLILILAHVVVHLDHKKLKSNEIQLSHWLLPIVFETMNSRTRGSMVYILRKQISDRLLFWIEVHWKAKKKWCLSLLALPLFSPY